MTDGAVAQRGLARPTTPAKDVAVACLDAVRHLVVIIRQDGYTCLTHEKAIAGLNWQICAGTYLQRGSQRLLNGVGPKSDVFRTRKIKSIVTKELGEALAFGIEIRSAEGIPFMQGALCGCRPNQAIGDVTEVLVFDGSQSVQRPREHGITNTSFQGIATLELQFIVDTPMEKAIVAQGVLGYLGSQFGICRIYRAGSGGKSIKHPLPQPRRIVHEAIVNPEPYGKRPPCGTASKDIIVRGIGQGRIHLLPSCAHGLLIDSHLTAQAVALCCRQLLILGLYCQTIDHRVYIDVSGQQAFHGIVGISDGRDDASTIRHVLVLPARFYLATVGYFRNTRIEHLALRQVLGSGAGGEEK